MKQAFTIYLLISALAVTGLAAVTTWASFEHLLHPVWAGLIVSFLIACLYGIAECLKEL